MQTSLEIAAPTPFDFAGTAYSHGWAVLAPNTWDKKTCRLTRIEHLDDGHVVRLIIAGSSGRKKAHVFVGIEGPKRLSKRERLEVEQRVAKMLRFEEDLRPFYQECRRRGGQWKKLTAGLGRLLRSPSLFEDVVKVIATTNIQWSGTKSMIAGLVEAFGQKSVGEFTYQSFPSALSITSVSRARFAKSVRMGYRADYVYQVAKTIVSGDLDLDTMCEPSLSTTQIKNSLLSIKGVGGYAAATLLMIIGRYDELPIDTVCRDFVSKKYFQGHKPTDSEIREVYEEWGSWKFLAYWFDVWSGHNEDV